MSENDLNFLIEKIILALFLLWVGRNKVVKPILKLIIHPSYKTAKPYIPEDTEIKQLAKIYKKLAKKYHPDRARTLPQKVYFEHMMKKINKAYSKRDLQKLLALATSESSAVES